MLKRRISPYYERRVLKQLEGNSTGQNKAAPLRAARSRRLVKSNRKAASSQLRAFIRPSGICSSESKASIGPTISPKGDLPEETGIPPYYESSYLDQAACDLMD
ncbi:unnamed protein product [Linum trigynum]|uniref:Uncharacterized protein n=1 Tax=Linum trigynum TaxID=586398 RepID=A0AAV2G6R1_9ROSI